MYTFNYVPPPPGVPDAACHETPLQAKLPGELRYYSAGMYGTRSIGCRIDSSGHDFAQIQKSHNREAGFKVNEQLCTSDSLDRRLLLLHIRAQILCRRKWDGLAPL